MKVIVGKMPGGRAQQIEVQEGATVLDAVRAAGYEADLNSGYEARLNNASTSLTTVLYPNSIISLTQKITGNSEAPIKVLSIIDLSEFTCNVEQSMFLSETPVKLNDLFEYEDIVKDIIKASDIAICDVLHAVVIYGDDTLSLPQSIIVNGDGTVTIFDNDIEVCKDDLVCIFGPESMKAMYSMDTLNLVGRIRAAIDDTYNESDGCCPEPDCEEACGSSCGETCECNNAGENITLKDLSRLCRDSNIMINIQVGYKE